MSRSGFELVSGETTVVFGPNGADEMNARLGFETENHP